MVSIPQAVLSSCNSVLGNALQDWIKNGDLDHRRIFFDFLPKSPWTAFLFFRKMPLKPTWFLRFFCPPLCWIIVFPTFLYYSGFASFLSMRQSMIRFLTIQRFSVNRINFIFLFLLLRCNPFQKRKKPQSLYKGFRVILFSGKPPSISSFCNFLLRQHIVLLFFQRHPVRPALFYTFFR